MAIDFFLKNVLFDQSKNEQISLSNGFTKLQIHLKYWKLSKSNIYLLK
jgi:hypothetical protein